MNPSFLYSNIIIWTVFWADRLKHDQQVASGDELHHERTVFILHNNTQQLNHSLMVQACHDVALLQQWPFTLPGQKSETSESQKQPRHVITDVPEHIKRCAFVSALIYKVFLYK